MNTLSSAAVLIVEDERIVAKDLQQALRSMGHDAFSIASSANEAIAEIEKRRPDLVLMDIRIRGARDGVETADIIRKRFGIPIVYLTSHADDATIERARKTAPYGYLLKPVKVPELRAAIELAAYKANVEKQERERERWLATTLECVPDPLMAVDAMGVVTFMNAAAERLIGGARADAVGFRLSEVLRVAETIDGAIVGVEPIDLERLRRLHSVYVRSTAERVREVLVLPAEVGHEGNRLGTIVVLRDVTDERARAKKLDEAERLDAAKTTIIGLANELNNPLAILVCNASFAKEELELLQMDVKYAGPALEVTADARFERIGKLLADDHDAILRIKNAFRELRALVETPGKEMAQRSSLSRAVERAVAATPEMLRNHARLELDLADDLVVGLDSERLATLLRNVTTNAFEAVLLVPPQLSEHVVRITSRRDGLQAVVDVDDSGEGIMGPIQSRVFDPFFTTRSVGHGLGLTVGRRIAASSGGSLELVASRPGETRMRIRVPLA